LGWWRLVIQKEVGAQTQIPDPDPDPNHDPEPRAPRPEKVNIIVKNRGAIICISNVRTFVMGGGDHVPTDNGKDLKSILLSSRSVSSSQRPPAKNDPHNVVLISSEGSAVLDAISGRSSTTPLPLSFQSVTAGEKSADIYSIPHLSPVSEASSLSLIKEVVNGGKDDEGELVWVIECDLMLSPTIFATRLNELISFVNNARNAKMRSARFPTDEEEIKGEINSDCKILVLCPITTRESAATFFMRQVIAYKSFQLRRFCHKIGAKLAFLPCWSHREDDDETEAQGARIQLIKEIIVAMANSEEIEQVEGGIIDDEDEYLLVLDENVNQLEGAIRDGASAPKRWDASKKGSWGDFVAAYEVEFGSVTADLDDGAKSIGNDDEWLEPLMKAMEMDTAITESILTPSSSRKAKDSPDAPKSDEKAVSSFFENLLAK